MTTTPLPDDEEQRAAKRARETKAWDNRIGKTVLATGVGLAAAAGWGGCQVKNGLDQMIAARRAEQERLGALKAIADDLGANVAYFKAYDVSPLSRDLLKAKKGAAPTHPKEGVLTDKERQFLTEEFEKLGRDLDEILNRPVPKDPNKQGQAGPRVEIAPPPRLKGNPAPGGEAQPEMRDEIAKGVARLSSGKRIIKADSDWEGLVLDAEAQKASADGVREITNLIIPQLPDRSFENFEAIHRDPMLQPSVLIEHARRNINYYLRHAEGDPFATPTDHLIDRLKPELKKLLRLPADRTFNPIEEATLALELAELGINIRERPASVTEEQDRAMRAALGEHIAELHRQMERLPEQPALPVPRR